MKRVRRADVLLVLLLSVAAAARCSNSMTGPGTGSCGTVSMAHGTMSATIDGAAWSTATVIARRDGPAPGTLALAGSDGCNPGRTLAIALLAGGHTGTFTIALVDPTGLNALLTVGPVNIWASSPGVGSGMIKIDTFTVSGASGSFSFTAEPQAVSGATGTKTITNGTFNVIF